MKLITKEFGEITVEDKDLIVFSRGIYGFEEYTKYVILKDSPDDDIMYLQSVDNPDLHFVIVDPYIILPHYSPMMTSEDLAVFKIKAEEINNLKYLLIAVISDDIENSVVNAKSPIVINSTNNEAIQAILTNPDYSLRHPLFLKKGNGGN